MKHDYTLQSTGTARMFRYTNETLQLNESGQFSNQLFLANNNKTKILQKNGHMTYLRQEGRRKAFVYIFI